MSQITEATARITLTAMWAQERRMRPSSASHMVRPVHPDEADLFGGGGTARCFSQIHGSGHRPGAWRSPVPTASG